MIQQSYTWAYTQKHMNSLCEKYPLHHVKSCIVHNSQKIALAKVSVIKWMDEENVVWCVWDGILLSHKKIEILCLAAKMMEVKDIMLPETSQ